MMLYGIEYCKLEEWVARTHSFMLAITIIDSNALGKAGEAGE